MPTIEFELIFVIPEIDGPGDPRITQAARHLDIVVETHSGLTLATITAEGANATDAGLAAAATLTQCDLAVQRSHPDFVTRQDIAARAEVTRQAVGNWVRGDRMSGDSFPTPVNLVSGGIWLWGDVIAWLRRNGHQVDDDMQYPSIEDHARIDIGIADREKPSAILHFTSEERNATFVAAVASEYRVWPEAADSLQRHYVLAQ